jgi:trehalose-6-phosphate synthase
MDCHNALSLIMPAEINLSVAAVSLRHSLTSSQQHQQEEEEEEEEQQQQVCSICKLYSTISMEPILNVLFHSNVEVFSVQCSSLLSL